MFKQECEKYFYIIVNSVGANEFSSQRGVVQGNGPSLLCEDEEHADQTRVPLQVFRIQGKETTNFS